MKFFTYNYHNIKYIFRSSCDCLVHLNQNEINVVFVTVVNPICTRGYTVFSLECLQSFCHIPGVCVGVRIRVHRRRALGKGQRGRVPPHFQKWGRYKWIRPLAGPF